MKEGEEGMGGVKQSPNLHEVIDGCLIFFSIVAFMVMSIISACLCVPYLVLSAIGVGVSKNSYHSITNHDDVSGKAPF